MNISEAINKSPEDAAAWLESLTREEMKNANIFAFAQATASNATKFDSLSNEERKKWSCISIKAYHIYSELVDASSKQSCELSEMNLRASMIVRMGAKPEEPLLKLSVIENWCISSLNEQKVKIIEEEINEWTKLPIERIKELRKLKNKLNVCKYLNDNGYLNENNLVQRLLKIIKQLP